MAAQGGAKGWKGNVLKSALAGRSFLGGQCGAKDAAGARTGFTFMDLHKPLWQDNFFAYYDPAAISLQVRPLPRGTLSATRRTDSTTPEPRPRAGHPQRLGKKQRAVCLKGLPPYAAGAGYAPLFPPFPAGIGLPA